MSSVKYAIVALILALGGIAGADTLSVDEAYRSQFLGGDRPARGMTMQRVRSGWGQPVSRRPAVGDPPITRWEYPGFIVYFEHDRVIHAVLKRRPAKR